MYKLKVISSTVRIGRKGPLMAKWIAAEAEKTGQFDVELLDLGEINLPMMNEPEHPSLQKYQFGYTRNWSAKIAEADAFIFVTAEYNHAYPAPLKNAIDYLVKEWGNKPAGILSYGGVSAGTRAANGLKIVLSGLRVVVLPEAVNLPMFTQFISAEKGFVPNETAGKAAAAMLRELAKWSGVLQPLRSKV